MAPQVAQLCKSSFNHLRKIARIRSYLTPETAKLLLHAFVTSKLDYCNSLLYGVPKYQILRLQRIQNVAARLVTATSRYALHLISRTFCNHTSLLAAFVLHPTIYLKSLATIYSLLVPVPSLLLRPLSGTCYRLNFEMLTQSMFLNLNLKLYFLERPLALSFTVHTYCRIVLDFLL